MDLVIFNRISAVYTRRRSQLMRSGVSQRPTTHGYWAASDPIQIFELFRKIRLEKSRSFVDLGSGDGIVAAIASLFTKSTGIEIDEKLHRSAEEIKNKLNLSHELNNKDYLDEDLSKYDIIFIYPDNYFHKLEKKLINEFKGTLIMTDTIFRPLTLNPKTTLNVRGVGFLIYELV